MERKTHELENMLSEHRLVKATLPFGLDVMECVAPLDIPEIGVLAGQSFWLATSNHAGYCYPITAEGYSLYCPCKAHEFGHGSCKHCKRVSSLQLAAYRQQQEMHDAGVTPGYWRAVSHNLNAVALECFIDEMAQAAGKDPIQYRIDMLDMGSTKHQWSGLSAGVPVGARMKRVLEEVRAKSGWGNKKLGAGKGMGVAVMEGYNTVIGMVAEVTVSPSYDVTVDKVTAVVDAGTLVHPDQALAQMQSTINFGQSACMWGEITIKNGGVEQTNFDMYRVARMNENPKVLDIHFIKSDSVPGGLGEPGTAVVQPAIGNAIFAACGKRCRTLPFTPENIGGSA